MNFKIEAMNIVRWLHFVTLATGGGAAVVALLLSGFEDDREDLRGLAATIWARVVAWGFRLALVFGLVLLVMMMQHGQNPFKNGHYFHIKLLLVLVLVGLSEMTPKALAIGKRGTALLTLVIFFAASFVMFNRALFGHGTQAVPELPAAVSSALPTR